MLDEQTKDYVRVSYKRIPFKRSLFTLMRRIYVPPQALYQHLYFEGVFDVDLGNCDFKMFNHNTSIETGVFWGGLSGYEKSSVNLWGRLCRMSSTILDIGANTGLYSLIAKTLQPHARVYSFEPIDRLAGWLLQNCSLNGFDINIQTCALSNLDGETLIYDLPLEYHQHASLNQSRAAHWGFELVECKTRVKRLDSFIVQENLEQVDLMKIDVEGHEPEVLEGMGSYLARMRPSLLIEIESNEAAYNINQLIYGLDYLFYDIDENNGCRRVSALSKSSTRNILLCSETVARGLNLQMIAPGEWRTVSQRANDP